MIKEVHGGVSMTFHHGVGDTFVHNTLDSFGRCQGGVGPEHQQIHQAVAVVLPCKGNR